MLPGAAWFSLHSHVTRFSMTLMCASGVGSQLGEGRRGGGEEKRKRRRKKRTKSNGVSDFRLPVLSAAVRV